MIEESESAGSMLNRRAVATFRMSSANLTLLALIVAAHLFAPTMVPAAETTAESAAYFEKHIRPLFAKHCYSCHSVKKQNVKAVSFSTVVRPASQAEPVVR